MVLEAGGTGCIWGPVRQSTVGTAAAVLLQGQLLFPECRLGIYCSMIRIYRQKAIRGQDATGPVPAYIGGMRAVWLPVDLEKRSRTKE